MTACYKAEFGFYGVIGSPRRMVCPRDATPITPPPTQPTPEIAIPDGADAVVEQVLSDAAPTPRAEEIRAALAEALGKTSPDALPGRRPLPPTPQVATDATNIGVALAALDDHSCLLALASTARSWCGAPAGCRSSRASSPAPRDRPGQAGDETPH